jgi:hypothetical protein
MVGWIATHKLLYTLVFGVVDLAIVLPIQASGHQPMWPVSVATAIVVGAIAALVPQVPRLRTWFGHRSS